MKVVTSAPAFRRTGARFVSHRGFTLLEVVVVLVILGILSTVAVPQYRDYLVRSSLVDAQSTMSQARVVMEQYFQDNRRYGTTGQGCGVTVQATAHFDLTCEIPARNRYTITATGRRGTRGEGYTFTVNESDQRTTTVFDGASVSKACWLTRSISDC